MKHKRCITFLPVITSSTTPTQLAWNFHESTFTSLTIPHDCSLQRKIVYLQKNNSRAKKINKLTRLLHLVLHGNYLLDLQQGNKMITKKGNSNKHNPVSKLYKSPTVLHATTLDNCPTPFPHPTSLHPLYPLENFQILAIDKISIDLQRRF